MKVEMTENEYVVLKEFININKLDIENASEIAMDYEINAYNTPNGDYPSNDDENYKLYEKYGWIWDLFNSNHWKWCE